MQELHQLLQLQPQLTVITATRRLSRRLLHDYNQQQLAAGLKAWPTPDILSWSAWVQREWQQASQSNIDSTASLVALNAHQSQQLWQSIIEASDGDSQRTGLINVEATARQSHNARQLVIDYALDLSDTNNTSRFVYDADASHWLDWHRQYEKQLNQSGWLDTPAMTQALVQQIIENKTTPSSPLCFMGFDVFTPLQWKLQNYLQTQDLLQPSPERNCGQADAHLYCAEDAADEIKQAASWARQQFEDGWQEGNAPIGVIVPKLEQQRQQFERIFREVFYPLDGLNQTADGKQVFHSQGVNETSVFNLSMGYPLSQEPMIAAALDILSLCHLHFSYDSFSQVLRSPFIKDAEEKTQERSQLDMQLRQHANAESSLYDLLVSLPDDETNSSVSDINQIIKQLSELKVKWQANAGAQQWVERVYVCLNLFGWPNQLESDSCRMQVMQSLDEVLFEFSRLDHVSASKNGMSMAEAFSAIGRLLSAKVFQSGAAECPIQIVGLLESAGMHFSSLWVTGMTEQEWPQPANPNPFIPITIQRECGMPHSSAQHELDYARHQTQRLLHTGEHIVFSYPLSSKNDEVFKPSPLVELFPRIETPFFSDASTQPLIVAAAEMQTLLDVQGPAVDAEHYQTGTTALKDQSACPFRSFVAHRLRARLPEDLQPGNDPRLRGEVVHLVMQDLWGQWRNSDALHALDEAQLSECVTKSVEKVVKTQAWRISANHDIEQQRLCNLVMEWIVLEKQRQPFEVVALEQKTALQVNQLQLNMMIDRLDELADGSRCVIDYKTGEAKSTSWVGERPDEPQVPVYVLSQLAQSDGVVNAAAFAHIRAGECKYEGATADRALVVADEKALAAIKQIPIEKGASLFKEYESWDDMLSSWQNNIEELAAAHVRGDAAVDPKSWPQATSCSYCDVKPVCRIFDWQEVEEE